MASINASRAKNFAVSVSSSETEMSRRVESASVYPFAAETKSFICPSLPSPVLTLSIFISKDSISCSAADIFWIEIFFFSSALSSRLFAKSFKESGTAIMSPFPALTDPSDRDLVTDDDFISDIIRSVCKFTF